MAPVFPGSVRSYSTKEDLVDIVLAAHVNLLQDEVTAIENTLGTSLLTSPWTGTFAQTGSWASLSARLLNIEAGLRGLSSLSPLLTITVVSGTTFTPAGTDLGKMTEMSSGSAKTVTLPSSDVTFPIGFTTHFTDTGGGQITFAPGSGATVVGRPGLKTAGQWSVVTAEKRTATGWLVYGSLTA